MAYGELPARTSRLPVYAPAALVQRMAGFFAQPDGAFLADVLDLCPLHDGHELRLRDVLLTTRAVEHGTEAYALRADSSAHTLVYSGDCAPCPALDDLAANADLLLCEANDPHPTPVHHTPTQAGELARRAQAQHLVITHVGPLLDPTEATSEAARTSAGRTTCAEVGATLTY